LIARRKTVAAARSEDPSSAADTDSSVSGGLPMRRSAELVERGVVAIVRIQRYSAICNCTTRPANRAPRLWIGDSKLGYEMPARQAGDETATRVSISVKPQCAAKGGACGNACSPAHGGSRLTLPEVSRLRTRPITLTTWRSNRDVECRSIARCRPASGAVQPGRTRSEGRLPARAPVSCRRARSISLARCLRRPGRCCAGGKHRRRRCGSP